MAFLFINFLFLNTELTSPVPQSWMALTTEFNTNISCTKSRDILTATYLFLHYKQGKIIFY